MPREQLRSWPWWVETRMGEINASILNDVPKDTFPFSVYGKYPPFALGAVIAVVASDGDERASFRNAETMVKAVNAVHAPPSQVSNKLARILMEEAGIDAHVAVGLAEALVARGCVLSPTE